ncbi:hypothetical protein [Lyngbya aestuarii]|uniref:hypothetical protein n=1 Tax=Lyngbya aestuarii TaxID=118322 RepID=UPI00403E3006
MRDVNQKSSSTDQQIRFTLLQSDWLSYLLSIGSTSAVVLSIFTVAAILDTEPVQANSSEPSAAVLDKTAEEEQISQTIAKSTEQLCLVDFSQDLINEEFFQGGEVDVPNIVDISYDKQQSNALNFKEVSDTSAVLAANTVDSSVVKQTQSECTAAINPISQEELLSEDELASIQSRLELQLPTVAVKSNSAEQNLPEQSTLPEEVTTLNPFDSIEYNPPEQLEIIEEPAVAQLATDVPVPTVGQQLQAQSSVEEEAEEPLIPQNSLPKNDALSPTLTLQGVFLNQEDSSARARLTGVYPISPNALFGATVDLTTGDDFADSRSEGLNINELYFTGSLPELPELRLTVGLMDLTSYFDRNSFAKDGATHFFNPVFQTNPALAATGIGSRPGALLNWNVTDNIEAKAAVFSSDRSLGDFNLDAFAGEIGFRAGTAILRGTFASDRDTGRDGIEGFPIALEPFFVSGTEPGDRENAFGINVEVFIPEISMGLFARYGWHKNLELDENSNTFSLGISFLDLFMEDDRLGLGYGQNLSNEERRRSNDQKIPDVWELFYDFRISSNLRAGVTFQGRDEFSEKILGVRVKTEFDLIGPRR